MNLNGMGVPEEEEYAGTWKTINRKKSYLNNSIHQDTSSREFFLDLLMRGSQPACSVPLQDLAMEHANGTMYG